MKFHELISYLKKHQTDAQGNPLYLFNAAILPIYTTGILKPDTNDRWNKQTPGIRLTMLPFPCISVKRLLQFYETLLSPKGYYYNQHLSSKVRALYEGTDVFQTNAFNDHRDDGFVNLYQSVTNYDLNILQYQLKTESEVEDEKDKLEGKYPSIWQDEAFEWTTDSDILQANRSEHFILPKDFYSILNPDNKQAYRQEYLKFLSYLTYLGD